MQVYVELAILENFCMDYSLLYCAKLTLRNPAGWKRISIAALTGAAFAVLFPLTGLGGAWAVVAKLFAGLALCLMAGKFRSVKSYAKFTAVFAAYSAVLAGALYGFFGFFGLEYIMGEGYVLSAVPVGIPLFGALLLVLGAIRLKNLFSKTPKNTVRCRIYAGQSSVSLSGFFDSGNKVYSGGVPVSVIPSSAAAQIVDEKSIKELVKIHTVAGSRQIKVFTADRLELDFGEKTAVYYGVKMGISDARIYGAVLHPDILEE